MLKTNEKDKTISATFIGNFALCLVSIQMAIQPFLNEKFIPRNAIKSSMVIIQELIKIPICLIILFSTKNLSNVFSKWTLINSLRLAFVPAIIYCVQNVVTYYAYLQLDPLTYNLSKNQSKIIFSAIFLKLILNKTPTVRQLIALLILVISSIMLTIDINNNNSSQTVANNQKQNLIHGLLAVVLSSTMSGLAAALSQKALQAHKYPRNSLFFGIEMAIYGCMFSVFRLFIEHKLDVLDGTVIAKHGFLYNFKITALIPISVNAIGGIGIGLIMKYTSVIHQSYAMIFGILLSGILRSLVYFTPISNIMKVAMLLVMVSFYSNTPVAKTNELNDDVDSSMVGVNIVLTKLKQIKGYLIVDDNNAFRKL
eukprot:415214_1